MDTGTAERLLNKFKVNVTRRCSGCGNCDVAFKVIYLGVCFCHECYNDSKESIYEYDNCVVCQSEDTYCYIDFDDGIYNRICKKCFINELEIFMNPPFNIKPAKR